MLAVEAVIENADDVGVAQGGEGLELLGKSQPPIVATVFVEGCFGGEGVVGEVGEMGGGGTPRKGSLFGGEQELFEGDLLPCEPVGGTVNCPHSASAEEVVNHVAAADGVHSNSAIQLVSISACYHCS